MAHFHTTFHLLLFLSLCVLDLFLSLCVLDLFPVRQYFQQGFYPSGEKSDDGEFRKDLWGSTVKAVLIAGATPLTDVDVGGRLGTNEGYGSLILNNVLPFKDDNNIDLHVTQVGGCGCRSYRHDITLDIWAF